MYHSEDCIGIFNRRNFALRLDIYLCSPSFVSWMKVCYHLIPWKNFCSLPISWCEMCWVLVPLRTHFHLRQLSWFYPSKPRRWCMKLVYELFMLFVSKDLLLVDSGILNLCTYSRSIRTSKWVRSFTETTRLILDLSAWGTLVPLVTWTVSHKWCIPIISTI